MKTTRLTEVQTHVPHSKRQGRDENSFVSSSKTHALPTAPSATTDSNFRQTHGKQGQTKLTCNGHCCRAAHNRADAVAGHALVGTRKGGGERKNSQSPLMNLDLLQVSVQSFSIMQPRDLSGRRVSRAMQNYRPTRFLDSRQWLRKKIRCQVYKGKFPVCKGGGE